jgi:acylphosphatase
MKLAIRITGSKVQDVGYRVFLLDRALALDLAGFSARNKVENGLQVLLAFAEGDSGQIEEFRQFVEVEMPSAAFVSEISFENYEGPVECLSSFAQKIYMNQLSKGISAVLRIEKLQVQMLDKQDSMLDKQDQMLDKQDSMLDKQDQMLDKQDSMLDKQDQTICALDKTRNEVVGELKEIKDNLGEHKVSLDERLDRMESDISRIKAKIGM